MTYAIHYLAYLTPISKSQLVLNSIECYRKCYVYWKVFVYQGIEYVIYVEHNSDM